MKINKILCTILAGSIATQTCAVGLPEFLKWSNVTSKYTEFKNNPKKFCSENKGTVAGLLAFTALTLGGAGVGAYKLFAKNALPVVEKVTSQIKSGVKTVAPSVIVKPNNIFTSKPAFIVYGLGGVLGLCGLVWLTKKVTKYFRDKKETEELRKVREAKEKEIRKEQEDHQKLIAEALKKSKNALLNAPVNHGTTNDLTVPAVPNFLGKSVNGNIIFPTKKQEKEIKKNPLLFSQFTLQAKPQLDKHEQTLKDLETDLGKLQETAGKTKKQFKELKSKTDTLKTKMNYPTNWTGLGFKAGCEEVDKTELRKNATANELAQLNKDITELENLYAQRNPLEKQIKELKEQIKEKQAQINSVKRELNALKIVLQQEDPNLLERFQNNLKEKKENLEKFVGPKVEIVKNLYGKFVGFFGKKDELKVSESQDEKETEKNKTEKEKQKK